MGGADERILSRAVAHLRRAIARTRPVLSSPSGRRPSVRLDRTRGLAMCHLGGRRRMIALAASAALVLSCWLLRAAAADLRASVAKLDDVLWSVRQIQASQAVERETREWLAKRGDTREIEQ